jgi:hypothetical protein
MTGTPTAHEKRPTQLSQSESTTRTLTTADSSGGWPKRKHAPPELPRKREAEAWRASDAVSDCRTWRGAGLCALAERQQIPIPRMLGVP